MWYSFLDSEEFIIIMNFILKMSIITVNISFVFVVVNQLSVSIINCRVFSLIGEFLKFLLCLFYLFWKFFISILVRSIQNQIIKFFVIPCLIFYNFFLFFFIFLIFLFTLKNYLLFFIFLSDLIVFILFFFFLHLLFLIWVFIFVLLKF